MKKNQIETFKNIREKFITYSKTIAWFETANPVIVETREPHRFFLADTPGP
jgi:hypothetical protein